MEQKKRVKIFAGRWTELRIDHVEFFVEIFYPTFNCHWHFAFYTMSIVIGFDRCMDGFSLKPEIR